MQLIVEIDGIRPEQGGNLIIALFDAEGSWPKHDSALQRKTVPVTHSTMPIKIDPLVPGKHYAIQVFHDRNSNNKLDLRWLPYPRPKEGVGVSNNNRKLGPPSFENALFQVEEGQPSISIHLNY